LKNKQTRGKTLPFRILIVLLYGSHGFASWQGDRVEVVTGPLARMLRTTNDRIISYFEWLAEKGYVSGVTRVSRGRLSMVMIKPRRWRDAA